MRLRFADREGDGEAFLRLNNAAVPHMNALTAEELVRLAGLGALRVAEEEGALVGGLLTLPEARPYESTNYRWFGARYDRFLYVDRVVVAPEARGRGVGRALYRAALDEAAAAGVPRVCAEVNLDPPNPDSLVFHERLGFAPVGEQVSGEGKRVRMFVLPLG